VTSKYTGFIVDCYYLIVVGCRLLSILLLCIAQTSHTAAIVNIEVGSMKNYTI